jgi:hypothetical protein
MEAQEQMRQGMLEWIMKTWTPLSAKLAMNTQTSKLVPSDLLDAQEHEQHLRRWVDSLKGLESFLIQDAVTRCDQVPAAAPMMVMETVSEFMQRAMTYMAASASIFKAYTQLYGYDAGKILMLSAQLENVISAIMAVSMDSMLSAMTGRPDKQTKSEKPAVEAWADRNVQMVAVWKGILGDNPDPAKMAEYSLRFQAELAKLAEATNPRFKNLPKPTEDDIQRLAQQTKIPVEKIREFLNGIGEPVNPSGEPTASDGGTQSPPGAGEASA